MEFLRKHKRWFILGLVLLSLSMMAFTGRQGYEQGVIRSSAGFVVTSAQALFSNIGDWFGARLDWFRGMDALIAENRALQAEIYRLEVEVNRFLQLEEEIAMMAEMMELHRHYADYAKIGANIISRDPSNWATSFIVDRGSRDGIEADMAVLAPGGLAGRVSRVGFNYAVITPLIEDGTAVTAVGLRTGEMGVVSGDVSLASRGLLRMNHIDFAADISPGDTVITSTGSVRFPPGLHIGVITEMGQTVGGLRYAIVDPAVDFARIAAVYIITDSFEFEME
ncbi:MAG: rod shape-determining protein MreC [Defluviitaleaceae bacterium]|nr:rod shape-determining protein MreC [Defluviitaleaceae bacterium]